MVGWKIGEELVYLAEGNAADTGTAIRWAQELGESFCCFFCFFFIKLLFSTCLQGIVQYAVTARGQIQPAGKVMIT